MRRLPGWLTAAYPSPVPATSSFRGVFNSTIETALILYLTSDNKLETKHCFYDTVVAQELRLFYGASHGPHERPSVTIPLGGHGLERPLTHAKSLEPESRRAEFSTGRPQVFRRVSRRLQSG
jgi:hypothetical protein